MERQSCIQNNQALELMAEQGLGDTLQFMRYAIALRDQGICVSLCAQTQLHNLIKTSGLHRSPLTPEQASQVTEGEWIPLLSVPRSLEVSPENPIITEPYIKTTEELVNKWAGILSTQERPIIGINWQGNPKAETTGLRGCDHSRLRPSLRSLNKPVRRCSHYRRVNGGRSWPPQRVASLIRSSIALLAARIKSMKPGTFSRPLQSFPTAIWSSPATPLWFTWQEEWARQPGCCSRMFLIGVGALKATQPSGIPRCS